MRKSMFILLVICCIGCGVAFFQLLCAEAGVPSNPIASKPLAVKPLLMYSQAAVIQPADEDKTLGYWHEQISKYFLYGVSLSEDIDLDAVVKGLPDKPLTVWQFVAALADSSGVWLSSDKYTDLTTLGPMPDGGRICAVRDNILITAEATTLARDKTVQMVEFVLWRFMKEGECYLPETIFAIADDGSRHKLEQYSGFGTGNRFVFQFVPEKPLKPGRYKFNIDLYFYAYTDIWQASILPVPGKTSLPGGIEVDVKKLYFGWTGCDIEFECKWDATFSDRRTIPYLPSKKSNHTITSAERQQLFKLIDKYKVFRIIDFYPYDGSEALWTFHRESSTFNKTEVTFEYSMPVQDITSLELLYAIERRSLVPIEIELDF